MKTSYVPPFSSFGWQSLLVAALVAVSVNTRAGEQRDAAVPTSPHDIRPLLIGASIPDLSLRTRSGARVQLKRETAGTPTVLIFYRGGWCPYCNTHLGKLESVESELLELGYEIYAISPDRPEKLRKLAKKTGPGYTLLSDSSMKVSKAFGIAFQLDDATLKKYEEYGIDLEEASGYDHHLLPVPAVFIVDRKGTIQFVYANPNYKVRLAPKVLLAAAKAALD